VFDVNVKGQFPLCSGGCPQGGRRRHQGRNPQLLVAIGARHLLGVRCSASKNGMALALAPWPALPTCWRPGITGVACARFMTGATNGGLDIAWRVEPGSVAPGSPASWRRPRSRGACGASAARAKVSTGRRILRSGSPPSFGGAASPT